MSDYKHGDWYCKPANKDEAEEIIKRAVASGAELYDTTDLSSDHGYAWDFCQSWGVYHGKTFTGDLRERCSFKDAKKYTLQQLRKMFPLSDEQVAKWDGEGLPSAGTVCRIQLASQDVGECEITYMGNGVYCYRQRSTGMEYTGSIRDSVFRPIHSERDKWVEAVEALIESGGEHVANSTHLEFIYEALKTGLIKAPIDKPSKEKQANPSDHLQFVGYTNGHQILYAAKQNDGEGAFYADTSNNCAIPLYMFKSHLHRIEVTTHGTITVDEVLKALEAD